MSRVKPPTHDNTVIDTFSITPVGDKEGQRLRSTAKVPAGFQDGTYRCGDASMKLNVKKPKLLTIKAQATMNGVTQTRIQTITIVP